MTQYDLQQISDLLDQKLEQKFDEKLTPIYKELKTHTKQLRLVKKDQKTMLVLLDTEQMRQKKRITHLEQHLNLVS
jgi:hypothetical protein